MILPIFGLFRVVRIAPPESLQDLEMNQQVSLPLPESKHDKFLRLMNKRLFRALEEMRLISQLSSFHYENTDAEAEEVVAHLDQAIHLVADAFGVPYKSAIGRVNYPAPKSFRIGQIDETDIAKALDLIKTGKPEEASDLLVAALVADPRQ